MFNNKNVIFLFIQITAKNKKFKIPSFKPNESQFLKLKSIKSKYRSFVSERRILMLFYTEFKINELNIIDLILRAGKCIKYKVIPTTSVDTILQNILSQ